MSPPLGATTLARLVRRRDVENLRRVARLFVAVSASACSNLLGDVEIERSALTPAAHIDGAPAGSMGGQGGSSAEPGPGGECEVGATQCVGSALSLCTSPGRWIRTDVCASPALCSTEPPGCQPPECGFDQLSCDGPLLRVCNPLRDGWVEVDRCASAAHCNPNARFCLAAPCAAGELRCNRGELQRCADDELDWVSLGACASQRLCEQALASGGSACAPPACEAGTRRCAQSSLQRCAEDLTGFEQLEACTNATLCELSLENGSALCEAARCATGEHACRGETLTVCNEQRTGFDDVQTCGSAALCDQMSGGCRPAACELGERRCDGLQIVTCNSDRTAFESAGVAPCADGSVCIDGSGGTASCQPAACAVGERRCQGARLEVCDAARTGFTLLESCGSEALCVETRRGESFECAAPACVAGQVECRNRNLARCNADLTGFDVVSCGVLGCNDDAEPPRCNTLL